MTSHDSGRPVSLDHMRRLTDGFGIIQHADYALPDYRSGYCTDDNSRALVVSALHHRLHGDALSQELAITYLAFLRFAQRADGNFHNFIGFDRRPLDESGSEECYGHALWSLAYVLYAPPRPDILPPAERLFYQALPWVRKLEHPRSRAFGITALYWWWKAQPEKREEAQNMARPLADYLMNRYAEHAGPAWQWILPEMTYGNAKLPEALFRAYQMTGEARYLEVATRTLDFLCQKTFCGDMLCLVGNAGWYHADDTEPPIYDQQPIDAAAMVEASLAAFDATGEPGYLRRAWLSLEWFFGRNTLGQSLYDQQTGGCYDGLTEAGVNKNRGAESTIVLLQAQLSVLEARQQISETVLSEGENMVASFEKAQHK